jgi:ornithine cyclodeaminase/alanine dehydrogenase-like protein (mu-crystallin family)
MLLLTDSEIESLLDVPALIGAVEQVFRETALGRAAVPAPVSLQLPGRTGRFLPMTAIAEDPGLAVVKLLGDLPDNADRGLPTQRSVIVLVDADDGSCVAVLPGRVPTRERTAAASAVATKHLAVPGGRSLGLLGAGALATAHVRSHLSVMDLERVVVWSRSEETRATFARSCAELPVEIVCVAGPSEVFAADVVCTLTPSRTPIVQGDWLRPGQHLNVVGAPPRPDHREADDLTIMRSSVFVDSLPTALAKSGDVLLAIESGAVSVEDIANELGDVIAGKISGRAHAEEITLFDSVGLASQDLAIGALLVHAARRSGIGIELDLAR